MLEDDLGRVVGKSVIRRNANLTMAKARCKILYKNKRTAILRLPRKAAPKIRKGTDIKTPYSSSST